MGGIKVSFEYPADWNIREIQGKDEKYSEVNILGPGNKENSYSSALSVTMYTEGKYASVEDAINDYKSKYSKFKEFKVVSSDDKGVEIQYLLKLPLYNTKAKDTIIREKVMFVKKGKNCFKIRYNSVEADFSKYLPSFHTLCETFQ